MRRSMFHCIAIIISLASSLAAKDARSLDIYFVDVEGGQATLIVTPQGQSLLIDTGFPGFYGRDADRIVAAAKQAGLKKIDYVLITHYHSDHVGGVPQLVERIPIGAFVDHGPNREDTAGVRPYYTTYEQVAKRAKHIVVRPGDTLPLKGIDLQVLTADGEHIMTSVAGGGQPNQYCDSEPAALDDPTENARSVGVLLTYGKFRFIDLGDLTKKKEVELVCPANRVGTVDVYLVTHHGIAQSNARAIVDALRPRVAVMENGARKGGSAAAWQTVHDSPGLEDMWQLHYAMSSDAAHNVAEAQIANMQEQCAGNFVKLSAQGDGSFTIVNSRNSYSKKYEAK